MDKRGNNEGEADRIKREVIEGLRMHFVFNTLNVIRYLVRNDQEKAYTALYDLAQFLRVNIESLMAEKPIPLKQEMAYARSYMNLEQLQRKRLYVEWHLCGMDGSVPCGSIYKVLTELIKSDPDASVNERTIAVEEDIEELMVKVFVVETGEIRMIPVRRRDAERQNEDDTGR